MSIKSLLATYTGRIYVYLADNDVAKRFLQDAENEGFLFCDGVSPTQKEVSDIFAINDDMTMNYVGFAGRIAYQSATMIGNQSLVKIDYRDIVKQADSDENQELKI